MHLKPNQHPLSAYWLEKYSHGNTNERMCQNICMDKADLLDTQAQSFWTWCWIPCNGRSKIDMTLYRCKTFSPRILPNNNCDPDHLVFTRLLNTQKHRPGRMRIIRCSLLCLSQALWQFMLDYHKVTFFIYKWTWFYSNQHDYQIHFISK